MENKVNIDEILKIEHLEELEAIVLEVCQILDKEGNVEKADELKAVLPLAKNRFSKVGQKELLDDAKRRIISILKNSSGGGADEKELEIIEALLGNVENYFKCMFSKKPHAKCSKHISDLQSAFGIDNEYDLQHCIYAILRGVFPLTRVEEYQDSGIGAVRKDICIDKYDVAIELKCTRYSITLKKLSEEIASDIVHYDNKNLYFLIYDKAHIIDNVELFKTRYESTEIDKKVKVFVTDFGL